VSLDIHNQFMRICCILLSAISVVGCQSKPVRFATIEAGLTRSDLGRLLKDLANGNDEQIQHVAEAIQRVDPDVLLINGLDYDQYDRATRMFDQMYLSVSQNSAPPVKFGHHYLAPVNSGIASGYDLDHDGKVVTAPNGRGYSGDAIGAGIFPGQGGIVLYSKFPIDVDKIRMFQRFKWKDMPGAMVPVDADGKPWYSQEQLDRVVRLSSKTHWDVPLKIHGKTVHVLVCEPALPDAEGLEQRNTRRRHDELRFWSDYIADAEQARYIFDDAMGAGGLMRVIGKPASYVLIHDAVIEPSSDVKSAGGGSSGAIVWSDLRF
jgi:3-phytase